SCTQAEYLLLEDPAAGPAGYVSDARPGRANWCAGVLDRLLEATGARYLRLSVEWANVEPERGQYDFALIDALLAVAERRQARVLLTVGVKGQRHPEYYLPSWLTAARQYAEGATVSDDPLLHDNALAMVGAVVRHVAASPAIDAWAADNEPFLPSPRAENWVLSRSFVEEEESVIRGNDSAARPVLINHAEHFVFDRRWEWTLADADVVGTSLYPFRNYEIAGHTFVVPILEIGPLAPNYAARARMTKAAGKQYWITELQAEPWPDGDIRYLSPQHPPRDLTPANFRRNVDYARRTGAERVYLWGAEWWLFQAERYGDGEWLELARGVIATSSGPAAPQAN
ncbi:MAG: beta-galactosidase, partial [Gemmataceae bacterium]|nr:beta-galactosidase [Gemmataceae bacterium]